MLKYILLGFLSYKPMTGYELKSIMDESTMHFWHAYHSQIYTTLRKLEEDGLLISDLEDGDDKLNRRRYTITETGLADVRTWLDQPLTEVVTVKEELLVRLFFSAQREPSAVIDELRFQRQLHQRKLDEYLNLAAGHMVGQLINENTQHADEENSAGIAMHIPFWTATLRFGIEYEQSYLRWLDETIAMVEAQQ